MTRNTIATLLVAACCSPHAEHPTSGVCHPVAAHRRLDARVTSVRRKASPFTRVLTSPPLRAAADQPQAARRR